MKEQIMQCLKITTFFCAIISSIALMGMEKNDEIEINLSQQIEELKEQHNASLAIMDTSNGTPESENEGYNTLFEVCEKLKKVTLLSEKIKDDQYNMPKKLSLSIKNMWTNKKNSNRVSAIEQLVDEQNCTTDDYRNLYHITPCLRTMFTQMHEESLFYPASPFGTWGIKKITLEKTPLTYAVTSAPAEISPQRLVTQGRTHFTSPSGKISKGKISDIGYINEKKALICQLKKDEQLKSLEMFDISKNGQYLAFLPNKDEPQKNYIPLALHSTDNYFILPKIDCIAQWDKQNNCLILNTVTINTDTGNISLHPVHSKTLDKQLQEIYLDEKEAEITIHFTDTSSQTLDYNFENIAQNKKLKTLISSRFKRTSPRVKKSPVKSEKTVLRTAYPEIASWVLSMGIGKSLAIKLSKNGYYIENFPTIGDKKHYLTIIPQNALRFVGYFNKKLLLYYEDKNKEHIMQYDPTTTARMSYELVTDAQYKPAAFVPDTRFMLALNKDQTPEKCGTIITYHPLHFTDNTNTKLKLGTAYHLHTSKLPIEAIKAITNKKMNLKKNNDWCPLFYENLEE